MKWFKGHEMRWEHGSCGRRVQSHVICKANKYSCCEAGGCRTERKLNQPLSYRPKGVNGLIRPGMCTLTGCTVVHSEWMIPGIQYELLCKFLTHSHPNYWGMKHRKSKYTVYFNRKVNILHSTGTLYWLPVQYMIKFLNKSPFICSLSYKWTSTLPHIRLSSWKCSIVLSKIIRPRDFCSKNKTQKK